jgi:hypothetical protein
MQITRNELDITVGPSDWFAGPVYIDVVGTPTPPSRVVGGVVHLAPRARTAWHTHPVGQTIFVTEGIGLCLREGGPVEELRPGTGSTSSRARIIGTAQHPALHDADRLPGGRRVWQSHHLGASRHRRRVFRLGPVRCPGARPATYRVSSAGASSRVSFPGLAIA